MEVPERDVSAVGGTRGARAFRQSRALLLAASLSFWGAGCAGQKQVVTPSYVLEVPGFWEVEQASTGADVPTKVRIGQFGDAVIDQGAGAQTPVARNYEARTADVHVWIYTWPAGPSRGAPREQVFEKLAPLPLFALTEHLVLPEQPLECDRYPRSYRLAGQTLEPFDRVKRPGFRTVLLGGQFHDLLLGVVARVEFEPDMARYCHNLRNLQVQLQNLLDSMSLGAPRPAPATGPASF